MRKKKVRGQHSALLGSHYDRDAEGIPNKKLLFLDHH